MRVTLLAAVIIAALSGLSSGCSQVLGITDITAADGSIADGSIKDTTGDHSAADGLVDTAGKTFCDRALWKATASVRGDGAGPIAGIDGNLGTRWSAARMQDATDWYQVDFGGPVKLTSITLDNTQAFPNDYPGAYELRGSSDGVTFESSPFASGSGSTKTVVNFIQRTTRAVKVKQVGFANNSHWWGIGEFQVACQP